MVSNLPVDYAKTVVYPAYREMLDAASKEKRWTWCEVCPDAIVSFSLIMLLECSLINSTRLGSLPMVLSTA